ncbi:MAG: beta-1,3-glucanase family protein, partial [Bacteroidota bacterium]
MRTLSFLALVVLAFACATGPTTDSVALTTPASTVTVVYTNNSGQDLVLGFLQGVPKSAPNTVVTQLPWLKKGGSTPTWTVPTSVPAPTAGASSIKNYTKDYLFEIKAGKTLTLEVPSYPTNNGFRCVVAELVYRTKIVQVFTPKSGSPSNYLAFPDLATSAFVFDKFEAGLTQGTPGIWNITAVDFVGIPMQLSKDGETVGFKSGVTAQGLFNELGSLPSPYAEGATQSPNTSSTTYRFFSPAHITNTSTLFDAALTNDLQQLDSYTGTVKYGQYAFSSFTVTEKSSASPVRYAVSASVQDGSTVTLDTVTSKRALNGRIGQFAGASQAAKTLGGMLSAALCRGVIGTPSDWGDIVYSDLNCAKPWDYYQNAPYDEYSKTVHQYSIDDKNYGFSYDDYFG